ncbi:unnamed protein product [Microthlaspi erraticum]|uniref:Uncharacterized protein n=1 Tax=Microthlaspi erraticum TaxID=1685480 RepID=A0A6D2K4J4_9BRAS|nr:unnamed protein product [Microthlaspi erraticum]
MSMKSRVIVNKTNLLLAQPQPQPLSLVRWWALKVDSPQINAFERSVFWWLNLSASPPLNMDGARESRIGGGGGGGSVGVQNRQTRSVYLK